MTIFNRNSTLCAVALLAALPLAAQSRPSPKVFVTEWDNVLPQIADGGGWSTRIILVNMGTTAATFNLFFYKDDGTGWNVQLKDSTSASTVWRGSIPIGGTLFVETQGTDAQNTQGWAYLQTSNWVSGMAIFKADLPGVYYAEGVVPFAPETDFDFFIPLDNRNGYVTSIALANPYSDRSATLSVQLRNPDGTQIASETITLTALQHIAFATTDRWPASAGKNGVIEFEETTGNAGVSSLGLLFSPRNTFTSMHPVSIDAHYY